MIHTVSNRIINDSVTEQRPFLYAREGKARLNARFVVGFGDNQKHLEKGIDEFSKIIGKGTVLDDNQILIYSTNDGRSFFDGEVFMSDVAGGRSMIHELGHVLEERSGDSGHTPSNVHRFATSFMKKGQRVKKHNR